MKYLIVFVCLLICSTGFSQSRIKSDSLVFGLSANIPIDVKRSRSEVDQSNYFLFPISTSGIMKFKGTQLKVDVFATLLDVELRQYVLQNLFVEADARWAKYFFNNDEIPDNGEFNTWIHDVNKYLIGVGYSLEWGILQLDVQGQYGYIVTSEFSHSFSRFETGNLKRRVTSTFKIPYTAVYGAQVYLGLWLSKRVHPFLNIEIVGSKKTEAFRTVTAEDWIPGNISFLESSKDSNLTYDFKSTEVEVGFKYYLR